jgi:hypothetical protein
MRILVLIAACGAASLSASELVIRDLRLAGGARSTGFDFTEHGTTVDRSGHDAFDSGWALEGGGRWSFARVGDAFGAVLGADAILETLPHGGGGLNTTWLRLCAGGGWAIDDHWTMTVDAGVLAGLSLMKHPASASADGSTATGSATGYDLRLGAVYLLNRRIGLGVHAGWLNASHKLSDNRMDYTYARSGWICGLEVAWRFTTIPAALE